MTEAPINLAYVLFIREMKIYVFITCEACKLHVYLHLIVIFFFTYMDVSCS